MVGFVIDLPLCPFLVLSFESPVADFAISIQSHLRPSHVPNPWYRCRHHLGFQRSWIPMLTGDEALAFREKAEETLKKRGSIDFSKQRAEMKAILAKAKF